MKHISFSLDRLYRNSQSFWFSFFSIIGYSSYSPTKYAVRALAESLYNEFQGQNIKIHLVCPSDTKTPGFEQENLTKPEETKKISETTSVYESIDVAKSMLTGIQNGDFYVWHDFLSGLAIKACKGMGPSANNALDWLLAPILALCQIFVLSDWNKITLASSKIRTDRFTQFLKK